MEYKRFLKKFSNESEYNSQKDLVLAKPHVVLINELKKVLYCKHDTEPSIDYSKEYFTIEALEDGLTVSLSQNASEYRIDEGNWISLGASTATPSIDKGQKISFKITNPTISSFYGIGTFTVSKAFNVNGNIMSLLYGDNFEGQIDLSGKEDVFYNLFYKCTTLQNAENLILPATTLADGCYYGMFYGCISLTTAPKVLPATTLVINCYRSMFNGCTSLTTAPELPATTLAETCYQEMFADCTSLTQAPELPATKLASLCCWIMFYGCTRLTKAPKVLPATTLAGGCYSSMFYGCTSLTTAPQLPATTLASSCYSSMFADCTNLTQAPELHATTLASQCYDAMFADCTSLTQAPELPATKLSDDCYSCMFKSCTSLTEAPELHATTLATRCYQYMFQGCTSLTTAPKLPATTLTSSCYQYMFNGCEKLNKITMLATDISATNCLYYWVNRVANNGTFVKNAAMTSLPSGINGIPDGWAVEDYDSFNANGYDYVDLGLPSGIKWAKLNVGATKESDTGLFFQWGDTQGYTSDQCGKGEGQKAFIWTDYKWCNGSETSLTKYCIHSSRGTVDNKTKLDLEDDGCHVHMGGDWRLPTSTNMQELVDNTNYESIIIEGMKGRKFTNKADSSKYIFLPDAECFNGSFVLGSSTHSWSSSLSDWDSCYANYLSSESNTACVDINNRCFGLPLRGVIGNDTNTTVEVDETSINLLSNVEVTEDSITLLGNNIKIDSDENNNYNIIIE